MKNARLGLILVLILLGLSLDVRLAFWVTLGIPTSICGGLWPACSRLYFRLIRGAGRFAKLLA